MRAYHILADNIRLSPEFYLDLSKVTEQLQDISEELGQKFNQKDAIKLHKYAVDLFNS